jgi:Domain of unknown function (DUF4249)
MMRRIKIWFLILFLAAGGWHCKQTYVSPYASPPTGYLVVEGYITGNGPTQFTLSRTIPLPGDSIPPPENDAQVQVEGNDNSVYPLPAQGNGVYSVDTLPLSPAAQYRLRISTANGENYLSDFTPFKTTPGIDSINWIKGADGVNIYVNTHDPNNATRYYQWQYEETWEYHSAEPSVGLYLPNTNPVSVIFRPDSNQIYSCWRGDISTRLLLGSSVKLSQDVIYEQLLSNIPPAAQQLSVLYSILVRQYALTEDGYNFLTLMQKNTESLGSIFDVQPSQLVGNIHCLSNPNEPVIGYISAGTVRQQRIFISNEQVFYWAYSYFCPQKDTLVGLGPGAYEKFFGEMQEVPTVLEQGGWYGNIVTCVDCRAMGGTTTQPSFWPN